MLSQKKMVGESTNGRALMMSSRQFPRSTSISLPLWIRMLGLARGHTERWYNHREASHRRGLRCRWDRTICGLPRPRMQVMLVCCPLIPTLSIWRGCGLSSSVSIKGDRGVQTEDRNRTPRQSVGTGRRRCRWRLCGANDMQRRRSLARWNACRWASWILGHGRREQSLLRLRSGRHGYAIARCVGDGVYRAGHVNSVGFVSGLDVCTGYNGRPPIGVRASIGLHLTARR